MSENNTNANNNNAINIVEQFIQVFKNDDKDNRKKVIESALITIAGVGLLYTLDYYVEKNRASKEEVKSLPGKKPETNDN